MPQAADYPQDPLAGMLAWYRAMGVDAAVGEEALDWAQRSDGPGASFKTAAALTSAPLVQPQRGLPSAPPPPRSAPSTASGTRVPPQPTAQRQYSPQMPNDAQMAARRLAEGAKSLDELVRLLESFDGCGLKTTAMNLCVFRGATTAKLMIVGEAPGREEDIAGKPFVGPPGQLLDKMLIAAGFSPDSLHITNAVYWRPPGNRAPTPEETEVCRPFLERQISLVNPDVILVLGGTAAKAVLSVTEGITRVRGRWQSINIGGREVRAIASLHPAYLLRTPVAKRQAWGDLLAIRAALQ